MNKRITCTFKGINTLSNYGKVEYCLGENYANNYVDDFYHNCICRDYKQHGWVALMTYIILYFVAILCQLNRK